jgi:hypothetical protein
LRDPWLALYEFGGIVRNTLIVAYRMLRSKTGVELFADIQEGFDTKLCIDSAGLLTHAGQVTARIEPFW